MVIPGYLGTNAILEKWSKISYENKVQLYTDFADLEKPDDVVDMFFTANHTGGDPINTKFSIDGETYEVEHFDINFEQPTDFRGQPQHEIGGGQITVHISQIPSNNLTAKSRFNFHKQRNWKCNPNERLSVCKRQVKY